MELTELAHDAAHDGGSDGLEGAMRFALHYKAVYSPYFVGCRRETEVRVAGRWRTKLKFQLLRTAMLVFPLAHVDLAWRSDAPIRIDAAHN